MEYWQGNVIHLHRYTLCQSECILQEIFKIDGAVYAGTDLVIHHLPPHAMVKEQTLNK